MYVEEGVDKNGIYDDSYLEGGGLCIHKSMVVRRSPLPHPSPPLIKGRGQEPPLYKGGWGVNQLQTKGGFRHHSNELNPNILLVIDDLLNG